MGCSNQLSMYTALTTTYFSVSEVNGTNDRDVSCQIFRSVILKDHMLRFEFADVFGVSFFGTTIGRCLIDANDVRRINSSSIYIYRVRHLTVFQLVRIW